MHSIETKLAEEELVRIHDREQQAVRGDPDEAVGDTGGNHTYGGTSPTQTPT